jgi:hypothetical protein
MIQIGPIQTQEQELVGGFVFQSQNQTKPNMISSRMMRVQSYILYEGKSFYK